ncbi:MAG: hypothetical protein HY308_11845 [Gammaproteobacteria bacterium]|nr:hypothetical protein [Gammaproteobacteria bacterium]
MTLGLIRLPDSYGCDRNWFNATPSGAEHRRRAAPALAAALQIVGINQNWKHSVGVIESAGWRFSVLRQGVILSLREAISIF